MNQCFVLFQPFLPRRIPFRELGTIFMEVAEHWGSLLEFIVDSREGANAQTFTGESVELELYGDRTFRARFALMVLIVNCGEHKGEEKHKSYEIKKGKKKKTGEKKKRRKKRKKHKAKTNGGLV